MSPSGCSLAADCADDWKSAIKEWRKSVAPITVTCLHEFLYSVKSTGKVCTAVPGMLGEQASKQAPYHFLPRWLQGYSVALV
jgi:hypothetical protein